MILFFTYFVEIFVTIEYIIEIYKESQIIIPSNTNDLK